MSNDESGAVELVAPKSVVKKSCNSDAYSQEVGPPPTITKERRRRFSSSEVSGRAAISNISMVRLRIERAWWRCLRKKTATG